MDAKQFDRVASAVGQGTARRLAGLLGAALTGSLGRATGKVSNITLPASGCTGAPRDLIKAIQHHLAQSFVTLHTRAFPPWAVRGHLG